MENIYDLLGFFDATIESYDKEAECGPFLEYAIINDNTIDLSFGFSGYDDYSTTELNLIISDNIITYDGCEFGYSVEASPEENGMEILLTGKMTINEFIKNFF